MHGDVEKCPGQVRIGMEHFALQTPSRVQYHVSDQVNNFSAIIPIKCYCYNSFDSATKKTFQCCIGFFS